MSKPSLENSSFNDLTMTYTTIIRQKYSSARCRISIVDAKEASRSQVLAFEKSAHCNEESGQKRIFSRAALLAIVDHPGADVSEAVVYLIARTPIPWTPLFTKNVCNGQAPILLNDFEMAERAAKAEKVSRDTVRRPCLTDAEIERLQVDSLSAGYLAIKSEKDRRLFRTVSCGQASLTDKANAHPIENIVAIIDVPTETRPELIDNGRIASVPRREMNYDIPSFRTDRRSSPRIQVGY